MVQLASLIHLVSLPNNWIFLKLLLIIFIWWYIISSEGYQSIQNVILIQRKKWKIRCFYTVSIPKRVMMMMNCFYGMVDRRWTFSLIYSRNHCQRSSPLRISNMLWTGFETVQNLSSGFDEWSYAVVITTTPQCNITTPQCHHGTTTVTKITCFES